MAKQRTLEHVPNDLVDQVVEDFESEGAIVVKTKENGTYELIEAEATQDDFVKAVEAYRAAGRINSAAQKARKARPVL